MPSIFYSIVITKIVKEFDCAFHVKWLRGEKVWLGFVNPILLVINYMESKKDAPILSLVILIY